MRPFVFAVLAIILGYSPDWLPLYVKMFAGSDLDIIGSIAQFEVPCEDSPSDKSVCKHKYILPHSVFERNQTATSIGIGIILVATEIYCGESSEPIAVYDDPKNPGRKYDSYNSYITVPLTAACRQSMTIKAWAAPNSTRNGIVAGQAVIGSDSYVYGVRRATEFFTIDIRVLVLLILVFSIVVFRSSSKLDAVKSRPDIFEIFALPWAGFLVLSSGLLQVIIPIYSPGIYSRVQLGFSIWAHFGPLMYICCVKIYEKRRPQTIYGLVLLISLVLAIMPNIVPNFGAIVMIAAVAGALVSISSRQKALFIYSLVLLVSSTKLMNWPFTPLSHITAFYVSITLMHLSLRRLRRSSYLLDCVGQGTRLVNTSCDEVLFPRSLADTARLLWFGRLTFFEPGVSSDCRIMIVDISGQEDQIETFVRASIPNIVTHVLTLRRSIWHLNAKSQDYVAIQRRSPIPGLYKGDLVSAVSVGDDSSMGVVSFTNYDADPREIERLQELRESALDILRPYFLEVCRQRRTLSRLNDNVRLSVAGKEFEEIRTSIRLDSFLSDEEIFSTALRISLSVLGTSGFISEVDPNTYLLKIKAINGYSESICSQYLNGAVVADPKNQQGPIPLAYSRNEIIIIPNILKISHVLHPVSLGLLQDNDTRSMVAIPISRTMDARSAQGSGVTNKWGILWIEQRSGNELTLNDLKTCQRLQAELEQLLTVKMDAEIVRDMHSTVADLMPAWAFRDLIAGGNPIDEEHGYIVVVDLKGSSSVAEKLGVDAWDSFVKDNVSPRFSKICSKYGFKMHQVIWDSFFFCVSATDLSELEFKAGILMASELVRASAELYVESNLMIHASINVGGSCARACIAFGDVTRGMTSGPNPTWSIVGSAMAIVSKVEQKAKSIESDIFAMREQVPKSTRFKWNASGMTVPAAGNDEIMTVSAAEALNIWKSAS